MVIHNFACFLILHCLFYCIICESDVKMSVEHMPDSCTDKVAWGDTVVVHYTFSLSNGTVFHSTRGKEPAAILLGGEPKSEHWHKSMVGMCVGEKRKVILPPGKTFGASENKKLNIPVGATIVTSTELISFVPLKSPNKSVFACVGCGITGVIILFLCYSFCSRKSSKKTKQK